MGYRIGQIIGYRMGARFSEGEDRRRHQPPWRSVSETSARKLKQRSHRPEPQAKAAFSLKGRCRRMRQRVGKENTPAGQARISTDKKMAPSIAGRPFFLSVEMGGVEPPSKQRAGRLSTRLSCLWLSAAECRKAGCPRLIPWVLTCFKGVRRRILLE